MRTLSSLMGERLFAKDRETHWRVRVADPSGTMVDYTVDGGSTVDWADDYRVFESVDQMAATATVNFFRETDAGTLAPYMTPGAEAIKAGRQITIELAVVGIGDSVDESDYWMLFDGYVDDVEWGGIGSRVTVECRNDAGLLLDAWTISENTYGNSVSPVPVQTVIQQLLDEAFSGSLTFETDGDPDLGIVEYIQRMQSVADAIKALTDINGWIFRPDWSDVLGDFRFLLYEPDRNQTTPLYTIQPSDYYDIPSFGESSSDIRNFGVLKWAGGKITARDDVSIAEYGRRRYIVLDATQDSQINSEAKGLAFITAVVSDLSQPLATQQARCPALPFVEINDFYRFTPNSIHYSTNQDMAVTQLEHRGGGGGHETMLWLRGKPTGGVTRWNAVRNRMERDTIPDADEPVLEDDDIQFYYTTPYGSMGFDLPGVAATSLGGWASTTRVSQAINGIFRKVTDSERASTIDLYRSIAVINESASPVPIDWECVLAYLSLVNQLSGGGVVWGIVFDPQGVYPAAQLYSCISPDELTAPDCSPALVYVSPEASDDVNVLGGETIPAGYGRIIHIKLSVSSGAPVQTTNDSVVFESQVPASSV